MPLISPATFLQRAPACCAADAPPRAPAAGSGPPACSLHAGWAAWEQARCAPRATSVHMQHALPHASVARRGVCIIPEASAQSWLVADDGAVLLDPLTLAPAESLLCVGLSSPPTFSGGDEGHLSKARAAHAQRQRAHDDAALAQHHHPEVACRLAQHFQSAGCLLSSYPPCGVHRDSGWRQTISKRRRLLLCRSSIDRMQRHKYI